MSDNVLTAWVSEINALSTILSPISGDDDITNDDDSTTDCDSMPDLVPYIYIPDSDSDEDDEEVRWLVCGTSVFCSVLISSDLMKMMKK